MKKILLFLITLVLLVGCGKKSELADTTWIGTDDSELIFDEKEFNWYQTEGKHDDNYYNGTYSYYRGSDAVEYITNDLKDYGVTKNELDAIFANSDEYNEENFIVIDLVYKKRVVGGETTTQEGSSMPWYGFILEDNTVLDVANMNTASYYKFTKKQ